MRQNVAQRERWISLLGGGALAVTGLRKRNLAGAFLTLVGAEMIFRGASGHCPFYGMLGIDTTNIQSEPHNKDASVAYLQGVRVENSLTVNRPAAELYAYWRKLETLPRFMEHLEEVSVLTDRRSRWVAKAPLGTLVSWEAEINNDIPGQLIGWRSLPGSTLHNAGSVHFDERGHTSTQVRVVLEYSPPAGQLGVSIAKLLGEDPESQIADDLARFKTLMETGEHAISEPPAPNARSNA